MKQGCSVDTKTMIERMKGEVSTGIGTVCERLSVKVSCITAVKGIQRLVLRQSCLGECNAGMMTLADRRLWELHTLAGHSTAGRGVKISLQIHTSSLGSAYRLQPVRPGERRPCEISLRFPFRAAVYICRPLLTETQSHECEY